MAIPAPLIALLMIVIIGGLAWYIRGMFSFPEPAGRFIDLTFALVIILALIFLVILPMVGVGGGIRVV